MTFSVLGINHHYASLDWRERLAVPAQHVQERVRSLVARASQEALILSTCNRTEIYCAQAKMPEVWHDFLQAQGVAEDAALESLTYRLDHAATVRHIFRVASGLDSMVLGETQILGQLKEAFQLAQQAGSLGQHLHHLVQSALQTAKDVRTQTALGSHIVSMPSAAIELIGRIFPAWSDLRVLLVGAGTMNRSFARAVAAMQPAQLTVVNRSFARAQSMATELKHPHTTVYPLELLASVMTECDIIICCTASPVPLIGKGMVEATQKQRRHRPMVLVDLGVPRNIEPEIHQLRDVFLYTVDHLGSWIRAGQDARLNQAQHAEGLVSTHVSRFLHDYETRQSSHHRLRALYQEGHALREDTLQQAKKRLARGDRPEDVMQWMGHTLTQRLLHPSAQLIKPQKPPEDF